MSSNEILAEADHLIERGDWKEARKVLKALLDEIPEGPDPKQVKAKAHVLMAQVLTMLSEHRKALRHCDTIMELAKEMEDRALEANAIKWIGHIKWKRGDYQGGLADHKMGLEIAKEIGDPKLEGVFYIETAMIHSTTGDTNKAQRDLREAILILERAGSKRQLARAYNNLGDNFMTQEKYEKAIDLFAKCKRLSLKANAMNTFAFGAFNRAESLFELGRYDEALIELNEAMPILEEAGDTYGTASANQIYGLVYAKKGEWHKAEEHLIMARRLAQQNSMPVNEAKIIRDIGRMYKWRGAKDKALLYFKEAQKIFEKHGVVGWLRKMKNEMERLE